MKNFLHLILTIPDSIDNGATINLEVSEGDGKAPLQVELNITYLKYNLYAVRILSDAKLSVSEVAKENQSGT